MVFEHEENALLDISDFTIPLTNIFQDRPNEKYYHSMGKRSHVTSSQPIKPQDIDDDSGFCGSNLTSPPTKIGRFDDEMMLLKALMKEVNEPIVDNFVIPTRPNLKIGNQSSNKLASFSAKSKNGKFELKILSQPEEQHRARYLTEGSRGAIKDRSGLGHPVIKLFGPLRSPIKIECFIGHDKHIGVPHLFYQASKITGKNSTRCTTWKVDGTTLVGMEACPEQDMQVSVDCIGILKERNVDVEQKLLKLKSKNGPEVAIPNKKRSTRCRLVFRCQIPNTNETLQVVSSPILCTQPLGTPEICKKSTSQSDIKGGQEIFIIGKNFLKDSKVVFKNVRWTKTVEPDKEFLHSTHLVCNIPPYDGSDLDSNSSSFAVTLSVKSAGKFSDAHSFTYFKSENANSTMTINDGQQFQITNACNENSSQLLMSNIEKPMLLTMIGSASNLSGHSNGFNGSLTFANKINQQHEDHSNLSMDKTMMTSVNNSNQGCAINTMNNMNMPTLASNSLDSCLMNSDSQSQMTIMMTSNSTSNQMNNPICTSFGKISESSNAFNISSVNSGDDGSCHGMPMTFTVNSINSMHAKSQDNTCFSMQPTDNSNQHSNHSIMKDSGSLSLPQHSQLLSINSINSNFEFTTIDSSNRSLIEQDNNTILTTSTTTIPSTFVTNNLITSINNSMPQQQIQQQDDTQGLNACLNTNVGNTNGTLIEVMSDAGNIMMHQNDPHMTSSLTSLPSIPSTTTTIVFPTTSVSNVTTQASTINQISELSDNELLRFINPATFDQIQM